MKNLIYDSYDSGIVYEHIQRVPIDFDFHLHHRHEIFFLFSGDVNYFIEKAMYPLLPGDLIITNKQEIHRPVFLSDKLYDRVSIRFCDWKASPFNSPHFNLLNCFLNRENGVHNLIVLSPSQREEVINLFGKIEHAAKNKPSAFDTLFLNYLVELLVIINLAFLNTGFHRSSFTIHQKLAEVLDYIDKNLSEDLTLDALEKHLYIDQCYLSKLFKKCTGSNLHEYIIFKRIAKAKKLLEEGFNATEAFTMCGFNDYSNFLKMFKRTVGITPGKYKSQNK